MIESQDWFFSFLSVRHTNQEAGYLTPNGFEKRYAVTARSSADTPLYLTLSPNINHSPSYITTTAHQSSHSFVPFKHRALIPTLILSDLNKTEITLEVILLLLLFSTPSALLLFPLSLTQPLSHQEQQHLRTRTQRGKQRQRKPQKR